MGKKTSARRRKRSGKAARRRLARLWPAAAAFGLAGIVALFVTFAVIEGEGGQSQVAPTPVTESSGGSQTAQSGTGGPSIHFSTSSIDLGEVPLNIPVSDAFEFLNAGDESLRIEGVDVEMLEGCWPFEPIVGSTILEPGEESEISFTTMMHEGMGGPHLFEITVRSNDPQKPVHSLLVEAFFGS